MKRRRAARERWAGPLRTCLGCGAREHKDRLIRLRAGTGGELSVESSAGRGGYLHGAPACWEKFIRRKSVYRAFHAEIGRSAKEKLVEALRERHGERDGKNQSPSISERTRN
jgi:predicted RNA-binding protein YlxR (DUF448 family)